MICATAVGTVVEKQVKGREIRAWGGGLDRILRQASLKKTRGSESLSVQLSG